MVSLARSILLHEWRKFLAAVLAVTTSIAIVLVQIGLTIGFAEKATFLLDQSAADLWITSAKLETFERPGSIHQKFGLQPMIHPQVSEVENIITTNFAFLAEETFRIVQIIGFDVENNGVGFPRSFTVENLRNLQESNTIILEKSTAEKWGVSTGDYVSIDNIDVKLVAIVDDFSVSHFPALVTSLSTAKQISAQGASETSYIVIKLKEGANPAQISYELQATSLQDDYRVWTADELRTKTLDYWLSDSNFGASFWVSSIIACIVGFIIILQIIRMLILDNIREYATLRALGVRFRIIATIVLEKCLWIAAASCLASLALALLGIPAANYYGIAIVVPTWLMASAFLASFLVCILAGLLSFRVLYRTEPADLLRV